MESKKVAAFSLLAHINDNYIGITSFKDIFVPIVKSALCKMNNSGIKSGQSIIEIKEQVDNVFALDIPIGILKDILFSISNEVHSDPDNHFILHKDGSFEMNRYLFADYEDELDKKESEINEVEKLYKSYLKSNGIDPKNEPSIFEYIDHNRLNLSKYFAFHQDKELEIEYVNQANFINSVRSNKRIYEILRRIYLGSIISAYLEVEIGKAVNQIELLLDTNFIIGILDLNSGEATHTCRKILEICNRLGYKKTVLPFTIEETQSLLERKANQLENAFFQGYLDPESIYNAAKRRNLTRTQLLQISQKLSNILEVEYGINVLRFDEKYRNLAKFQYAEILEFYKKLRGDHGYSAHHDTTAIAYVKDKRGNRPIKGDFLKANCWFVTNTPFKLVLPTSNGYLPEVIRAEEILNILWLSNPNVTQFIDSSELSSLGLTRLVSSTISYSLPSSKVLRNLDENFNTYAGSSITADDALMIASMISQKKISEPNDLNILAHNNQENFIAKVKELANQGRKEEKELKDKFDKVLDKIDQLLTKQNDEKTKIQNAPIQVIETAIESSAKLILEEPKVTESKTDESSKTIKRDSNYSLKVIILILSIFLVSFIWLSFDKLFPLPSLLSHPNYYIIKIAGELVVLATAIAIFSPSKKGRWFGAAIAFIILLLSCFIR